MMDRDPTNWNLVTWVFAIGFAAAGGVVNWYSRIKQGHTRAFNIVELFGEIFVSGFVGLMVFMVLAEYQQPIAICAVASGIGGHMATRLLFAVEKLVEHKIKGEGK